MQWQICFKCSVCMKLCKQLEMPETVTTDERPTGFLHLDQLQEEANLSEGIQCWRWPSCFWAAPLPRAKEAIVTSSSSHSQHPQKQQYPQINIIRGSPQPFITASPLYLLNFSLSRRDKILCSNRKLQTPFFLYCWEAFSYAVMLLPISHINTEYQVRGILIIDMHIHMSKEIQHSFFICNYIHMHRDTYMYMCVVFQLVKRIAINLL